jgi:hypothetical protein
VKVLNFAHAAFKQPQQLTRVAYLFAFGYRPDVVIELDGFNETALAFENGRTLTHPLYPSAPCGKRRRASTARIRRGRPS